jgi:hypothetical protein
MFEALRNFAEIGIGIAGVMFGALILRFLRSQAA